MTKHCQNCNSELNGNFCSHCGQSSNTHRLNFHFLWHDIQHGLLHIDKGILYTTKELFTRPGHSIREFLLGKRVKHFKPISLEHVGKLHLVISVHSLQHDLNVG
ncbi:MAG: DUF3667 domain-containing protein [Bacteroidetes bacterium]|nr:DUF3667 domain-containing protein [Fibrella sp.]